MAQKKQGPTQTTVRAIDTRVRYHNMIHIYRSIKKIVYYPWVKPMTITDKMKSDMN